jgi:hypothetical protein
MGRGLEHPDLRRLDPKEPVCQRQWTDPLLEGGAMPVSFPKKTNQKSRYIYIYTHTTRSGQKTRHDKPRQDKTRQDKPRQGKTRQDKNQRDVFILLLSDSRVRV